MVDTLIIDGTPPDRPKVIRNFEVGEDVLVMRDVPNLTFFDLVNPLRGGAGGQLLIEQVDDNTVIRLPDGVNATTLATLKGVNADDLIASPESFRIESPGNTIINWNELTFDAVRTSQPGGPGT
ncbi:hypothetical protein, partial [Gloeocapsa sp. PCC 73106]|uniref:hypothetical protein n=1 Tax=Gloeocapsa sp. PCC 73106 TaxID=102232 RepID=UPI0002ABCC75